jgi:hypothetical protein
MAKHNLKSLLRTNPRASAHGKTIKDTLGALKKLQNSGLIKGGYYLESPFGGNVNSAKGGKKHFAPQFRMTFDA